MSYQFSKEKTQKMQDGDENLNETQFLYTDSRVRFQCTFFV